MTKMDSWCILVFLQLTIVLRFTAADVKQECITSRNQGYGYGDTDPGEYREPDEGPSSGEASRYPVYGHLSCSGFDGGSIVVRKVRRGVALYPGTCQADTYCGEESGTGDNVAATCDGQSTCRVDMRTPAYLACGRMSDYMHVEYECINSWATFDVCKNASVVAREPSVYVTSPSYLGARAPPPSRGAKMCECIIRSQDGADLYLEYLQTRLASEQQSCPYEYALLQNKENLTQSSVDSELEVCGQRRISARWFRGTIRLILATGGGAWNKRALIAKITADNLGAAPRLDVECGTVPSTAVRLKKRPAVLSETVDPAVTRSRINPNPYGPPGHPNQYPPPGSYPVPPPGQYPGAPYPPRGQYSDDRPSYERPSYFDDSPYEADEAPDRYERYYPPPAGHQYPGYQPPPVYQPPPPPTPPQGPVRERTNIPDPVRPPRYPGPPNRNPTPPGGGFLPDISRLRVKFPAEKPTDAPPARAQPRLPFDSPKPNKPEVVKKPTVRKPMNKRKPEVRNARPPYLGDRRAPKKKGTGRIVDEQDQAMEKTPLDNKSGNGSLVALVFGGIGSVLILGSVGILALHNYRKRQRIKREEAEYAYSGSTGSSYGRGWSQEAGKQEAGKEGGETEEEVYSTVREVDMYKAAYVNPSDSVNVHPDSAQHPDDDIDSAYAQVSENFRSNRFVYDGPAASDVISATQDDLAVIEVHQEFDGAIESASVHQHDTDCLRQFGGSSSGQEEDGANPYCKSCEIRRPPRRRERGGYDNNVSVRKHMP